jgi:predicted lipoprotein with Yx(FWY)xxD motif
LHKHTLAISFVLAFAAAGLAAACGGGSSYGSSGGSTTAPTKAGAASNSTSQPTVKVSQSKSLGSVLTSPDGRTLYVFLSDKAGSGKSTCNGGCAQTWPALAATGDVVKPDGLPGDLSVITRDDGTKAVAYNGQPLYHYAGDSAPGDTNGQGIGNVWFVVPPSTVAVSGPAGAQPTVKVAQAGALGQVLVGPEGRTLYMFTKDVAGSGKSACTGACSQTWPPFVSTSGQLVKPDGFAGELSLITRDDGTREVAYNGQPLYYYSKDAAPGDTNGQGFGNLWYVVPGPASTSSSGGSTSTAAYGAY